MISLGVLASGNGTNFEALCEAFKGSALFPALLVCDQRDAPVFARAERLGVPNLHLPFPAQRREEAAAELTGVLKERGINLVALAGFMKVLPPSFVREWKDRLLNIHPSLLPRHQGTHAVERAFQAGDAELGITVHLVDEGVDTGPVLHQNFFRRESHDTWETIEKKIHALEHLDYPMAVRRYAEAFFGVRT